MSWYSNTQLSKSRGYRQFWQVTHVAQDLTLFIRIHNVHFLHLSKSDGFDLALHFLIKRMPLRDKKKCPASKYKHYQTENKKVRRVWISVAEKSQLSVCETHDRSCGTKTGVEYIAFPRAWKTRPLNKTVDLLKPAKAQENLKETTPTPDGIMLTYTLDMDHIKWTLQKGLIQKKIQNKIVADLERGDVLIPPKADQTLTSAWEYTSTFVKKTQ